MNDAQSAFARHSDHRLRRRTRKFSGRPKSIGVRNHAGRLRLGRIKSSFQADLINRRSQEKKESRDRSGRGVSRPNESIGVRKADRPASLPPERPSFQADRVQSAFASTKRWLRPTSSALFPGRSSSIGVRKDRLAALYRIRTGVSRPIDFNRRSQGADNPRTVNHRTKFPGRSISIGVRKGSGRAGSRTGHPRFQADRFQSAFARKDQEPSNSCDARFPGRSISIGVRKSRDTGVHLVLAWRFQADRFQSAFARDRL